MKILQNLKAEIPGTNTYYFDLLDYSEESESSVLIYGYDTLFNPPKELARFKNKKYFNVTMPTEFCSDQDVRLDDSFDEIYSICPYSCEWLNEIKDTDKYKPVWYPFNLKYIPDVQEKRYDVCYHGGIHGQKYVKMLNIINKFNYRYMSMTHSINELTQDYLSFATDLNLSYQEKLKRVAETRISVCYNNLPCYQQHIHNITSRPHWRKNQAFKNIGITNEVPQLKCRFIEASFSRTLNLVERDSWNIIENFYKPNEHFIYFEGNEDLQRKIQDILENYGKYEGIVEKSFRHSYDNYHCGELIKKIKNHEM